MVDVKPSGNVIPVLELAVEGVSASGVLSSLLQEDTEIITNKRSEEIRYFIILNVCAKVTVYGHRTNRFYDQG
jgi:hypothetical protein